MKSTRQPIFFAASLLVLTMLACALPGQTTASTPAPTFDSARLDTMIAKTVTAAIAQTQQAEPTATQAPINTPVPTETPSPTLVVSGSSLTQQSDGTTLFADSEGGYQLSVAPGWLPVRINEQEYYDAYTLEAAADTAVQDALMSIQKMNPNDFRLFVYDLQDGHLQNGFLTNINLIWDRTGTISLENEDGIKELAAILPNSMPNLVVQSSSIATNANDVKTGTILSEIPTKAANGTDITIIQKQVFINLETGVLVITFTTDKALQDATMPFFDTLVESIKLTSE